MSKMLSEARRTQSEEDSSGSDSGSEVSLEPETDRFGFILTNGSTAGDSNDAAVSVKRSVGPSPELVRQREAKWISMIGQWDRILLKKSSKVKLRCQKGIPASLRSKCWPLLCGATDRMRQNKNLYESLDSEPGLQSWVDIIERDLDRQFPFHEMFLSKDGHGQRGLFRVLKAYTQFQPEEGYCQAQGPVAAVLLMNMPAEEAFWCLVQVSEQYLPGYYSPLLEGVLFDAAILAWVLKKTCPAAHKHLQQHGVEPLMFATDWLMCLFTRHLPFNTLVRVWDLFFCHGVRVLLQVAVVLVRRVLGRAEQRKECVGQMETLEMLRGVKAHVQDEEDAFIAEVCSVPLSTKDLEKRTEKVLGRWRKDRPSSTFDPRGRCHGFRTAWARARQREEERERKEREKGNLSVPLECSASTLSLSPSLLHKRWKKGGKVNAGDPERGNKVVRHFSMGAKDNWRNWTDLEFKKVQDIHEEEDAQGGHKTKTEFKEKESEEHLEEPKVKNIITEHKEETVTVQQTNKQEESVSKEEESQPGSRTPLEQKEERPANDQTAETVSQPTEVSSLIIQETLNDENRSQSPEEQNPHNNDQDSEVPGTNEETETGENDPTSVENNHSEIQREDPTNAEAELQGSEDSGDEPIKQADTKPEEETENTPEEQVDTAAIAPDTGSETNPDQDQDPETDPQQEHEEAVTETKEDVSGEKRLSDESSVETPEEEAHARMETETQGPVKNAITQDRVDVETTRADTGTETNTEEETQMPPLPESIQQEQDDTETTDAQSDAEELPTNTSRETTEPELIETGICALTKSEETQTPAQMGEETADCVAPAETEETLTQSQELSEESSTPAIASETRAPERPACMVPAGAAEAVENTEKVQENPAGKVSTSAEPAVTDSNKQIHDKDSWAAKDQSQASGRRSSCSSGDVCVRKSSSSKLTRRLSEDLFTTPEKTNQLKEVKTIQTAPDETPTEAQQPDVSKRFGLFRKLKGEQPRKDKKKKPKMQVPKILIQDFSDVTEGERPVEGGVEEQLSSRERRRRRREQERKEKEEERLKRKKEKERKKPQTRGKSFQEEGGKSRDETHPGKTGSQTFRFSASHAESYF